MLHYSSLRVLLGMGALTERPFFTSDADACMLHSTSTPSLLSQPVYGRLLNLVTARDSTRPKAPSLSPASRRRSTAMRRPGRHMVQGGERPPDRAARGGRHGLHAPHLGPVPLHLARGQEVGDHRPEPSRSKTRSKSSRTTSVHADVIQPTHVAVQDAPAARACGSRVFCSSSTALGTATTLAAGSEP